jgi:hypothetical protein
MDFRISVCWDKTLCNPLIKSTDIPEKRVASGFMGGE